MKGDGRIMLLLFITAVLVLQESFGQMFPPQTSGKWRNPYIQWHVQRLCRNIHCPSFEGTCDLRTYPCTFPPCDVGPTCIPSPGSSSKPGSCPSPYTINTRRIRCNEDISCYGSDVCCHGFFGSECRPAIMF